jgi:tRNA (cytidine32/guanosine34-2'-O)-methyltransferase
VTGLHDLDEYVQAQLLLSALQITRQILAVGGTFVAKVFRGKDFDLLYSQLKCFFEQVTCAKPRSSRNSSIEAFVVCQKYSGDLGGVDESFVKYGSLESIPFVACGSLKDAFDSDRTYEVPEHSVEPMQQPIDPPYKTFKELRSRNKIQ